MKNLTTSPYWLLLGLALWVTLGMHSCGSTRKVEGDGFYQEYSRKLGVNFRGNENKEMIKAIHGWMGVPYKYGGTTKKGVDCSAFVASVYRESLKINLPRSAKGMAAHAQTIRKNNLQFGDLVFFSIKERKVSHIGLYLGNDQFVHASSTRGVVISQLSDNYYTRYYAGAGRVTSAGQTMPGSTSSFISTRSGRVGASGSKPTSDNKPAAKSSVAPPASTANEEDIIIVFDDVR